MSSLDDIRKSVASQLNIKPTESGESFNLESIRKSVAEQLGLTRGQAYDYLMESGRLKEEEASIHPYGDYVYPALNKAGEKISNVIGGINSQREKLDFLKTTPLSFLFKEKPRPEDRVAPDQELQIRNPTLIEKYLPELPGNPYLRFKEYQGKLNQLYQEQPGQLAKNALNIATTAMGFVDAPAFIKDLKDRPISTIESIIKMPFEGAGEFAQDLQRSLLTGETPKFWKEGRSAEVAAKILSGYALLRARKSPKSAPEMVTAMSPEESASIASEIKARNPIYPNELNPVDSVVERLGQVKKTVNPAVDILETAKGKQKIDVLENILPEPPFSYGGMETPVKDIPKKIQSSRELIRKLPQTTQEAIDSITGNLELIKKTAKKDVDPLRETLVDQYTKITKDAKTPDRDIDFNSIRTALEYKLPVKPGEATYKQLSQGELEPIKKWLANPGSVIPEFVKVVGAADDMVKYRAHKIFTEAESFMRQIPRKSKSSELIAKALDGQIDASSLNSIETTAYLGVKKLFQDLANEFGIQPQDRIADYFPHIFKKLQESGADISTETRHGAQIVDRFFKSRQPELGAKGWELDIHDAVETYVNLGLRKVYFEPALKQVYRGVMSMDGWKGEYARMWFDKSRGDPLAINKRLDSWSKFGRTYDENLSLSYYRDLLGLSIPTMLKNTTQSINTIAAAGILPTMAGASRFVMKSLTKEGRMELQQSGVLQEVKNMVEVQQSIVRSIPSKISDAIMMPMTATEYLNRGIAYHTGYFKFLSEYGKSGLTQEALHAGARAEGVKLSNMTQFKYGIIYDSPYLRDALPRSILQFSSFPIKQANFVYQLYKHDKTGIIRYLAMTGFLSYTRGFDRDSDGPFSINNLIPSSLVGAPAVKSLAKASRELAAGSKYMGTAMSSVFTHGIDSGYTIQNLRNVGREWGNFLGSMAGYRFGYLTGWQPVSSGGELGKVIFADYPLERSEALEKVMPVAGVRQGLKLLHGKEVKFWK